MIPPKKKLTQYIKYTAQTVYIGEYIDLKEVQENIKKFTYLNREQPLVIKLLPEKYIVLTKFGAVTFWNVSSRSQQEFLKEIKPYAKNKRDSYQFDEETKVWIGGETDKVTFDKIILSHFSVSKIKIISHVLSQSVALERYEDEIDSSMKDVWVIVENLRSKGRVLLKERDLLKRIGEALSVKQSAMAHLSLLNKPRDVWESAELENLYNRMHAEYELRVRFNVLDEKIRYLSDFSQMIINFLTDRRMAILEWVIIILIAIEVVIFVPIPWDSLLNFVGLR